MDANKKKLIIAVALLVVAVGLLAWYFTSGAPKAGTVVGGQKNELKEGQQGAPEGSGGGRQMGGPKGPSTGG